MHRIALLGTHGLPARHGAFEQTIFKICEWSDEHGIDAHFAVGCDAKLAPEACTLPNVDRLFAKRRPGLGILLYDFVTSAKAYAKGYRTFVYFGYEFAPFFLLFRLLGVKIICNVDGIEWRRAKWGKTAKLFFKWCEWFAARAGIERIYDAVGIERYFGITHQASGHTIFYGSDPLVLDGNPDLPADIGAYYSCVMRMEPENNILSIVQGFAQANTEKTLLVIGPSTKFFDTHCRPFIDGRKVRYLGPIYDRARLNAIRAGSFAYIHGHSVGGTNPTLIEAIGLGNKVLAYNSIFNREVCGEQARYFNNAADLAQQVEQEQFPLPPALREVYTWPYVIRAYLKLCGISATELGQQPHTTPAA